MLVIYSSGLLDQAMSMLIFQVKQRKNDYTSRDIVGGGRWRNFINSWTSSKLTQTLVRVFSPSGLKPAPPQKAINLKKYGLEIENMMKHREKHKSKKTMSYNVHVNHFMLRIGTWLTQNSLTWTSSWDVRKSMCGVHVNAKIPRKKR